MTAINVVLRRDSAVMMTDAAIYSPQGLVLGFGQKAVAIPGMKAVVAVRGAQKITALLAMEMSVTFRSIDQLIAAGDTYFDAIMELIADTLPEGLEEAQIVVAGWSDAQDRAVGCIYCTSDDDGETFRLIDNYAFAPLPDENEFRRLRMQRAEIEHSYRPSEFDPIRHGIPLLEAQRRMKIIPIAADMEEAISIVGGNVLLTEVDRDGVSQRIVHEWPDVASENIAPEPFSLYPTRPAAAPNASAIPAKRTPEPVNQ